MQRQSPPPKPSTIPVRSLRLSPTERRNPRSRRLDKLPVPAAIRLMLSEESKVTRALLTQLPKLERSINLITCSFQNGGRLVYVGAGTSGRLGVLDASECPPTFNTQLAMVQGICAGGRIALGKSVEAAEDDFTEGSRSVLSRKVGPRDVVVGIAASGTTPFVWGALAAAKQAGAATVLLCFNPYLRFRRGSRPDVVIAPDLGPEVLTGSTRLKAGTATKLVLNLFTTLSMVRTGKVISNFMVDVRASNTKLRQRALRITRELTGADEPAALSALKRNGWSVRKAVALLAP